MIPKTIHYCWFGRNDMPKSVTRCIESWRKHCPDYTLQLWTEDIFDINFHPCIQEEYKAKK